MHCCVPMENTCPDCEETVPHALTGLSAGNGRCRACGGTARRTDWVPCLKCYGTGRCVKCQGLGFIPMQEAKTNRKREAGN
jgi:hypothetical protein